MKYEVVIFDLDGTILNTLDDLSDSCNYILAKNNFPTHTKDEIRMFVGNGIPKLIERALPQESNKETQEKILNEFRKYYEQHSQDKTKPYDGIQNIFSKLHNLGIKVAVNTNKSEDIAKIICDKYFPGAIDYIAGGKKDVPHKPDPSGVYTILKELNIKNKAALYVGDSDVDYMTGINSGIDVVNVSWGFRSNEFLREHGSKIIFEDTEKLLNYIIN